MYSFRKQSNSSAASRRDRLLYDVLADDADGDGLTMRTRREYHNKMCSIAREIGHGRNGSGAPLRIEAVSDYLEQLSQESRVSKATFKMYKAVALYWIKKQAREALGRGESLDALSRVYERVKSNSGRNLAKQGMHSSGLRSKRFPPALLKRIEEYAKTDGRRLKHMGMLLAFLRANMVLGLRPAEWMDVAFATQFAAGEHAEDGHLLRGQAIDPPPDFSQKRSCLAMYVSNAKSTHGRGNGKQRVILLDGLSEQQLTSVALFRNIVARNLSQGKSASDVQDQLFRALQSTLRMVLQNIGIATGSREWVTLYSTRHQAIANAKKAGLSPVEIAALFGHVSPRTAFRHYARAASGVSGKFACRPDPASVAAVRGGETLSEPVVQRLEEQEQIRQATLRSVDQLMGRGPRNG